MLPALIFRTLCSADKRCIAKFLWNFGVKGLLSIEKFKRRIKRGDYFPPFLYLSILNSCNLRCQGCWVDVEADREMIDLELLNRTITDAKQHGNAFFGSLGGEPFMHPQLLDLLASHPDCYLQIFTNGQFMTEKIATELRRLENCLAARLLTGVATSVCQTNIAELLTRQWLQELINRGVHYVWYHTYRPVGPKMNSL